MAIAPSPSPTPTNTTTRPQRPVLAGTGQRILTLDIIRGYFISVIVIDHLQRFPGLFDVFTGRGQLWVSAAEGFFFISGLVIAIVRGHELRTRGFRAMAAKVWSRGLMLYIWSVALTLGFTYIAFALGNHPGIKSGLIGQTSYGEILRDALLFRYSYGWADFLPHYTVFLAAAPIILYLLQRRLAWFVALASLTMWTVAPPGLFDARWQILFVSGMLAGHYLPAAENRFRQLAPATRRWVRRTVVTVAAASLALSTLVVIIRSPIMAAGWPIGTRLDQLNNFLAPVFDKATMPIPRILLFWLCFAALYLLIRRYESRIAHIIGWLLIPLGRNSLYVYILHSVILFILPLLLALDTGFIINVAVNAAVIGLLWLSVRKRLFFSIIPR